MGLAVIINNLDQEQTPTKKDVEAMGHVLKTIGGLCSYSFLIFTFCFWRVWSSDSQKPDQPADEQCQEEIHWSGGPFTE